MSKIILSVDPGKDKVGVAFISEAEDILWQGIVIKEIFIKEIRELAERYKPSLLIMGNRTGSKVLRKMIEQDWPTHPEIVLIEEHLSSEEARKIYLQANPGHGWRRMIPLCFKSPDKPYDDYAAIILGKRYFRSIKTTPE